MLIIITPMVLLQLMVTYVFFERHYQLVTRRLSESVAGEIAMILSRHDPAQPAASLAALAADARDTMGLDISFQNGESLPPDISPGFFNVLQTVVDAQLKEQITYPYWFDTSSIASTVDIRVALDEGVMRVLVRRSRVLATNWHIFLVWMVLSSIVLLTIALLFLRNQTRSIVRLAHAAEAFGRGRDVPDFRPTGALEVRAAARALIDMRNRLARHVDQRTDMLAGISHDLRTPLTRIRLQLALIEQSPDVEAMKGDLDEMDYMLDEYLAFARGEGTEEVEPIDIVALIKEIAADTERRGRIISVTIETDARAALAEVPGRRGALKRCITNLIDNTLTYAQNTNITLKAARHYFEITVDDDGPGIAPEEIEDAFKPFRRLDNGLRAGVAGSGLGLAISRDLARSHGGEIHLSQSPQGGLRAAIRLPL